MIKKRGRIPACDSFIVKRVAGPGMASDYYFQIRPEQALAAFEAKMELDELNAYQNLMEQKIQQPQKDFARFVDVCFGPFSAHLAKNGTYRILEKEAQDLMTALQDKLERRLRELQSGLSTTLKSKIRLTSKDLKVKFILKFGYINMFIMIIILKLYLGYGGFSIKNVGILVSSTCNAKVVYQ